MVSYGSLTTHGDDPGSVKQPFKNLQLMVFKGLKPAIMPLSSTTGCYFGIIIPTCYMIIYVCTSCLADMKSSGIFYSLCLQSYNTLLHLALSVQSLV